MANTIKLKRGTSTPTTSDISNGEVAIDTSAKKLFVNDSGTVKEIGGGSGGGVTSDDQDNTVGGTNAGDSFDGTNAEGNTLFGKNAGTAITTGDQSTCVGKDAGKSITTAARLTAIGHRAGEVVTGQNNTIVGANAGLLLTSGTGCTIVGTGAGDNYTSQSFITAIGNSAGGGTGTNGTYVGYDAGGTNSSAQNQTFIGKQAGRNSSGGSNTAIGSEAMFSTHDGTNNVAVGANALYSFTGTSFTGSVALGTSSLYSQTSGNENTACGRAAGFSLQSGVQNTLLGNFAGYGSGGSGALTTGDNNIIVGYNAVSSAVDVDNEITFGNTSITKFRIPGLNFTVKDSGSSLTEGHVLTLDSNGEASFAAASGGGGGSWNLISTTTVSSSVSSVDFTSIGSYNRYVLLWDCEMDGNNIPKIQIYDNGSLITSSNYFVRRSEFSGSGGSSFTITHSGWITSDGLQSQIGMFEISVAAPRATMSLTVGGFKGTANSALTLFANGGMTSSYSLTDIDGFRFTTTAGTAVIDSGRFSLYGIGQ